MPHDTQWSIRLCRVLHNVLITTLPLRGNRYRITARGLCLPVAAEQVVDQCGHVADVHIIALVAVGHGTAGDGAFIKSTITPSDLDLR